MDFGVTWDNEYVSLQMLAPDYQPMVGYPLSHTRGTDGRQVAQAVIVELQVRGDLAKYRGTLKGKAVLSTPPATIDLAPLTNGVPRRTPAELEALQQTVVAPARPTTPRPPPNPELLTAEEKMAFYRLGGGRRRPAVRERVARRGARLLSARRARGRMVAGRDPRAGPSSWPSRRSTTTGCTGS